MCQPTTAAGLDATGKERHRDRGRAVTMRRVDTTARHLRLLTETIAAVNSSLDLQEVLELVASKVADALGHGRLLRLPVRRAHRRARPARDARNAGRGADAHAADAAGRGDHRGGGRGASAGADRRAGASRSALQALPEPARGRVRVDPGRPDPGAGHARGCAQRPHAGAARVHRRGGRAPRRHRLAGRADDRARQAVRAGAAARRGARGARADLRGGLGVALPRGVRRRRS